MHNTDEVRKAESHTAGRSLLTVLGSSHLVPTTTSSQATNTKYIAYNIFFTVFGTFVLYKHTDLPGTQGGKALLNH